MCSKINRNTSQDDVNKLTRNDDQSFDLALPHMTGHPLIIKCNLFNFLSIGIRIDFNLCTQFTINLYHKVDCISNQGCRIRYWPDGINISPSPPDVCQRWWVM